MDDSIWFQGRPPKLMAATAMPALHVITTTILLNVLGALWASLDRNTHDNLHIRVRWTISLFVLRCPLMLAQEAHHCIITQIAQAHTTRLGAINLHDSREECAPLQPEPVCEHAIDFLYFRRESACMVPEAAVGQSHTANALNVQYSLRPTSLQLLLDPSQPAEFTSDMARAIVGKGWAAPTKQRDAALLTNWTDWARINGRGVQPCDLGKLLQPFHLPVSSMSCPNAAQNVLGLSNEHLPQACVHRFKAAWLQTLCAKATFCPTKRKLNLRPTFPAIFASDMATWLVCQRGASKATNPTRHRRTWKCVAVFVNGIS